MTLSSNDDRSETTAYETRDVRVRPLVVFAAGLAVALLVCYLIVLGLFRLFSAKETARDATADPAAVQRASRPPEMRLPPAPRIQADPAGEYQQLRRQEDAILESYGWVNREAGVVRIPIDVAMKLTVAEGLPVRPLKDGEATRDGDGPGRDAGSRRSGVDTVGSSKR